LFDVERKGDGSDGDVIEDKYDQYGFLLEDGEDPITGDDEVGEEELHVGFDGDWETDYFLMEDGLEESFFDKINVYQRFGLVFQNLIRREPNIVPALDETMRGVLDQVLMLGRADLC
jgi:hypothetical protein